MSGFWAPLATLPGLLSLLGPLAGEGRAFRVAGKLPGPSWGPASCHHPRDPRPGPCRPRPPPALAAQCRTACSPGPDRPGRVWRCPPAPLSADPPGRKFQTRVRTCASNQCRGRSDGHQGGQPARGGDVSGTQVPRGPAETLIHQRGDLGPRPTCAEEHDVVDGPVQGPRPVHRDLCVVHVTLDQPGPAVEGQH